MSRVTSQQLPLGGQSNSLYKVKEVSGQRTAHPNSHSTERYCSLLTGAETVLPIISGDLCRPNFCATPGSSQKSLLEYFVPLWWEVAEAAVPRIRSQFSCVSWGI